MPILRIEHPIIDFDTWKASFDRFDDFRKLSRVRSYRVLRPVDDAHYVVIDLEFDSSSDANAMLAGLRQHWRELEGTAVPVGTKPQALIAEAVDARRY